MQPIARLAYAVSIAGGLVRGPHHGRLTASQLNSPARNCLSWPCTVEPARTALPKIHRPNCHQINDPLLFLSLPLPPPLPHHPTLSSLDALDHLPDLLPASPLQEARPGSLNLLISLYGAISACSEASRNIILDLQVRRAVLVFTPVPVPQHHWSCLYISRPSFPGLTNKNPQDSSSFDR